MKSLTKSIALALLAGSVTLVSAQSTAMPPCGLLPFSAFDRDGSGAISEQEFDAVRAERRAARAAEGRAMRNAPYAPAFSEFDLDGDGQLSPDELTAGQTAQMQKRFATGGPGMNRGPGMGRGAGWGRNMPSFAEFDLDGDGVMVEDEFIEARGRRISERARQGYPMRGLGSAPPFTAVDRDGDGQVTPEEFSLAQALHRQNRFQ